MGSWTMGRSGPLCPLYRSAQSENVMVPALQPSADGLKREHCLLIGSGLEVRQHDFSCDFFNTTSTVLVLKQAGEYGVYTFVR